MSKTVKLDQATYDSLEKLRTKSETYSQAVARLLNMAMYLGLASAELGISPPKEG